MAGNQEPEPEWLQRWLDFPFYRANEKCSIHIRKFLTIYCGVCMLEPVCETCWGEHYEPLHNGDPHQILKVYKASGRAATEIRNIKKLLDTSGIQNYIINGKDIFHLRSKSNKASCGTCRRVEASFCSIACKYGYEFRDHAAPPDMGPQIVNSPQRVIEPPPFPANPPPQPIEPPALPANPPPQPIEPPALPANPPPQPIEPPALPPNPPPESSEPRPIVDEKNNKMEIRMRKRPRKQLIPQRSPLASYGTFECY
ncbi:hypothetical protein ABFX02_11G107700 [Erythranthe guttata]